MQENITISMKEYDDFVRAKQKAEQYKRYFLEVQRTETNRFTKALCAIEGKSLFELLDEDRGK